MQSHNAWMKKARSDFAGAKILTQDNINDLAVYHAHQSAEKALKAFLAYKLCPIQKSHNLVVLTELCSRHNPSFDEIRPIVESLNPFGTITSYPNNRPDPDQKVIQDAILKAEQLLLFIQTKILES